MKEKRIKVRFFNDFHKTSVNAWVTNEIVEYCHESGQSIWFEISIRGDNNINWRRKLNRITKTLCGISDCYCSPVSNWEIIKRSGQ
jgi:hypothetical protein